VTKQTLISNKAVKIEISDNGPGISTSDLPYIFDPFFSNKKKGTGLGLSNVKKIIEAHGGAEKVPLRKPRGIRFSFTVPFREIN
jgi:signal transduction histidine kinase